MRCGGRGRPRRTYIDLSHSQSYDILGIERFENRTFWDLDILTPLDIFRIGHFDRERNLLRRTSQICYGIVAHGYAVAVVTVTLLVPGVRAGEGGGHQVRDQAAARGVPAAGVFPGRWRQEPDGAVPRHARRDRLPGAAPAVRRGRGAALGARRPLPLHDRRLLVDRTGAREYRLVTHPSPLNQAF